MQSAIREYSAAEVLAFVKDGRGVLIDVLVPEHHAVCHIPGSVNACVFEVVFQDTMAGLVPDKTTPVIFYGAGGNCLDCETAADKLFRAGYTEVGVYPGGLEDWREQGLPLEGGAPDEMVPPHPKLVLESKVYRLLPDESMFRWTGRNAKTTHTGSLTVSVGELDAASDHLSASFTLDMASIRNFNLEGDELQPVLENHLKSDDFFFAALFPEAEFNSTKICPAVDSEATRPNFLVQGVLTLRGVSNEIAFQAHLRNLEDDRIALVANVDFDRTQWGVIYGSSRFFKHLGYHSVFDFISVEFRLVLA
ncbi:hypothetical protein GM415_10310 [Pseudodesulfovibrio cashew]|uniref:Rhodanese domain-containing protein n=1 Tax=Pseudodesulfovibrio cashew TaxID=2678688 RepID=A0A6I6JHJ3_9BACT|nr:YceI family protein [Pseudodesulfovibrio cashew]QGY40500.1 hypothetical protein GM415_10310 [Pseudodesulfovibrio cashew]